MAVLLVVVWRGEMGRRRGWILGTIYANMDWRIKSYAVSNWWQMWSRITNYMLLRKYAFLIEFLSSSYVSTILLFLRFLVNLK